MKDLNGKKPEKRKFSDWTGRTRRKCHRSVGRAEKLNARRMRIAARLASAQQTHAKSVQAIARLKQLLSEATNELAIESPATLESLHVSEHAIIQYMRRIFEIDMEQIRQEIAGGDYRKMKSLPNGIYTIKNDKSSLGRHFIRVVGGVVVTVYAEKGQ